MYSLTVEGPSCLPPRPTVCLYPFPETKTKIFAQGKAYQNPKNDLFSSSSHLSVLLSLFSNYPSVHILFFFFITTCLISFLLSLSLTYNAITC